MPMRVGFAQFRKQMLEKELQNIQAVFPQLGIEKAILTGDMAAGDFKPDTRIALVIVHQTEHSFGRRADYFSYHLESSVEIEALVYTPDEFETLSETLPALSRACREGQELFSA